MSVNVRWGVTTGRLKDGGWTPLWKRDSRKLEQLYLNDDVDTPVCIRNTHATADIGSRTATENYNDDAPSRRLVRGTWFWRFGGANGCLVAFNEDTAATIEAWYQQIKVSLWYYLSAHSTCHPLTPDIFGVYLLIMVESNAIQEEVLHECLEEEAGVDVDRDPDRDGPLRTRAQAQAQANTRPFSLPLGEVMGPGEGQYRVSGPNVWVLYILCESIYLCILCS